MKIWKQPRKQNFLSFNIQVLRTWYRRVLSSPAFFISSAIFKNYKLALQANASEPVPVYGLLSVAIQPA